MFSGPFFVGTTFGLRGSRGAVEVEGPSDSRSQSPTKLRDLTVRKIARPEHSECRRHELVRPARRPEWPPPLREAPPARAPCDCSPCSATLPQPRDPPERPRRPDCTAINKVVPIAMACKANQVIIHTPNPRKTARNTPRTLRTTTPMRISVVIRSPGHSEEIVST